MTLFELVKQTILVRDAAEHYGLQVNRSGMCRCPFHDDRHPSMKLNEKYFYCFGCGATGDVIDLVARLFGLSSFEAAQKLAQDFGIDPDIPGGHCSTQAETFPAVGIPAGGRSLSAGAMRLSASFRTLDGAVRTQDTRRCFG